MQSLSAFFEDNKPLAFTIMFGALLVLIIVLFLLYRLLFGRRLKASAGGRARQPRLGIVDAFDLDRQRQLVLVRRDNVEHLIMIGGPNDVVLESSIVRTASVATMSPGRDKDSAVPAAAAAPQIPAAAPLAVPPLPSYSPAPPVAPQPSVAPPPRSSSSPVTPSPALPPAAPPPPPAPERAAARPAQPTTEDTQSVAEARPAQPVGAPVPAPPPRTAAPSPAPRPAPPAGPAPLPPRTPATPLPPRPALTPRQSSLPPRPPLPPRTPATPLPPRNPATPLPIQPGSNRGEPPALGGVTPGGNAGSTTDNAPPIGGVGGERPAAQGGTETLQRPREPEPAANAPRLDPGQPKGFETLESLEEEMAKLLGRTTPRRDG